MPSCAEFHLTGEVREQGLKGDEIVALCDDVSGSRLTTGEFRHALEQVEGNFQVVFDDGVLVDPVEGGHGASEVGFREPLLREQQIVHTARRARSHGERDDPKQGLFRGRRNKMRPSGGRGVRKSQLDDRNGLESPPVGDDLDMRRRLPGLLGRFGDIVAVDANR
jgi:hypothetical protein